MDPGETDCARGWSEGGSLFFSLIVFIKASLQGNHICLKITILKVLQSEALGTDWI